MTDANWTPKKRLVSATQREAIETGWLVAANQALRFPWGYETPVDHATFTSGQIPSRVVEVLFRLLFQLVDRAPPENQGMDGRPNLAPPLALEDER